MTITAFASSDQRHLLVCLIDQSSSVDGSANGKSATLLVFQNPQTYPVLGRLAVGAKHIIKKLGGFLEFRRYPRNEGYMSTLAAKCLPGVIPAELTFRDTAADLSTIDWNAIGQVVLLWPDANGTGWLPVERRVLSCKSAHTRVHVLNGRGRYFELTPGTWFGFVARRFVEKSFLPETVFLFIFLITSPFLAFADFCTQRER